MRTVLHTAIAASCLVFSMAALASKPTSITFVSDGKSPDGQEYARQDFEAFPGNSENIRTSFSPGFAGGDPKVFYHQPIRFAFRVSKGDLTFATNDLKGFKFRFFKKEATGDVDWRIPFQTITATLEE